MPLYVGSQKVGEMYVGGTKVGEGWIWDGSQWVQVYSASVPFVPAGMTKSGVQTLGNTTRQRVTGWSVRSGFPGTVIDGNRIRVVGDGPVTVFAQVNFVDAGFSTNQKRWIVHNGADVAFVETVDQENATASVALDVRDGDYLWIDAQTSATSFAYDDIATTTYVTITGG